MTGALCLTVTFLPAYYEPARSLVDKLKGFQFSKRIIQYHCPTCGCQMMARCVEDAEDPDSKVRRILDITPVAGHRKLAAGGAT